MSDAEEASQAFDLLALPVQKWIWDQGWSSLRGIQEEAIPEILAARNDIIIAAGTASGKTEAAFLPIISGIVEHGVESGFSCLYVAPLKALINDQFRRVDAMCADLGVQVVRWHGDVSHSIKVGAAKAPSGILLTTPESLEAMLLLRTARLPTMFGDLRHIVIDEMHAFLDGPRGFHLQSVLHRLEGVVGRPVARIGLSATLADMRASAAFLRPERPTDVRIIDHSKSNQRVRIEVKGYVRPADIATQALHDPAMAAAALDIYEKFVNRRGIFFAGSRNRVETLTAELKECCEASGSIDQFFAHHGSLSKEAREDAEKRLRQGDKPGTIVSTTTLEMGLDVGGIDEVGQLGPGSTVSGMRQRLGRSGRREGQISVMRVYVIEDEITEESHPLDSIRLGLIQTIAMIDLMLERWNEPPRSHRVDVSVMLHQVLALIHQKGEVSISSLWADLVESNVFFSGTPQQFSTFLRAMGGAKLIEQGHYGLLLGEEGEKLVSSRGFFAVFKGTDEIKVVGPTGKPIGMIPVTHPVFQGQFLIIGGRRWQVSEVLPNRKEIKVFPAKTGKPPAFLSDPADMSDGVAERMRTVLEGSAVPRYLDATSERLLAEARSSFADKNLNRVSRIHHGDDLILLPWTGSRTLRALSLSLNAAGIKTGIDGVALTATRADEGHVDEILSSIARSPAPDPIALTPMINNKATGKFDELLPDEILDWALAQTHVDTDRLPEIAKYLMGVDQPGPSRK